MIDNGSSDQKAWVKIARDLRNQMATQIPHCQTMSPSEMKDFVEVFVTLRWLNERVLCFDSDVDRALNRLPFDND